MHILLTDHLTCPRCGPSFGLILLADGMEERRVDQGALGCPNCRERYPIRMGFGDLRAPPRSSLGEAPEELPDPPREESLRVAAFLGVQRGPGHALLVGPVAVHARNLAAMIEDLEVVAAHPDVRAWPEAPGVTRVVLGSTVPVFPGALRGVVLSGEAADTLLEGAVRAVGSGGRVVLQDAPHGAAEPLQEHGLTILAREEGTVVAAREGGGGTNVRFRRG